MHREILLLKPCFIFKCLGLSQYKSNESLHGDWKNSHLVEFGKSVREFVWRTESGVKHLFLFLLLQSPFFKSAVVNRSVKLLSFRFVPFHRFYFFFNRYDRRRSYAES